MAVYAPQNSAPLPNAFTTTARTNVKILPRAIPQRRVLCYIYIYIYNMCIHIYIYVYTYVHIHIHTHTHMHYMNICVHMQHIHTYIHTCMHTYIRTYIYIYIYIYIDLFIYLFFSFPVVPCVGAGCAVQRAVARAPSRSAGSPLAAKDSRGRAEKCGPCSLCCNPP